MNKTFNLWKTLESKVSRWFVLLSLSIFLIGSAIALRSPLGGARSVNADTLTVLHFHGNTEDAPQGTGSGNCTGVAPVPDLVGCDGPFLMTNGVTTSAPAAHWDVNSAAGGTNNRTIYDTSWVWRPGTPTSIGGTITVQWWADVNATAVTNGMEWRIKLSNVIGGATANATPPTLSSGEFYQAFHTATPTTPGVPQKLTATFTVPQTNVTDGMVLTIEPRFSDSGAGSHIWYDSTGNCSTALTGPCDSTITVNVLSFVPTPTPTPDLSPTPTPTPVGSPTPTPPPCAAAPPVITPPPPAGVTLIVNSSANAGPGTLRQAILDSNASFAYDTITFSGVSTIPLTDALPAITSPVFINGGATPTVELNGLGTQDEGPASIGLWIRSGSTTVRGMIINRFAGAGIRIDTDGVDNDNGNTIIANRIGTNAAGTSILPNFNRGILIIGSGGHAIGDGTAAGRNLISGNWSRGIDINGGGSAVVSGNYIGTDAAGTGDLGNSAHGIQIANSCGSTIGGVTAGARNVISGNDGSGIHIVGDIGLPASFNTVSGNYIGVDNTGNTQLHNDGSGIFIQGSQNNIGGATAAARNVIAGNASNGITIASSLATLNIVSGNYIGVGADGTTSIQNANDGVRIGNNAADNLIGGTDTTPGSCNNSCNLIANNGAPSSITARAGLYIEPTAGTGNQVRGNSIFSNGLAVGLGIDLGTSGATANDAGDTDAGANDLQNSPTISSAGSSNNRIAGSLNSVPGTSFAIDFYSNTSGDGAASEARTFIGSTPVTTDGGGNATFNYLTPVALTAGQFVTATATRATAPFDTSEISAARVVTSAPTAAGVSISGRVLTAGGRGIRSASVSVVGPDGRAIDARTNALGYFKVDGLPVGAAYVVAASATGYHFKPRLVVLSDNISNFDLVPE